MVKKLSEKQFTNMSDDTFTIYISIIVSWTAWKMQCSSLDLSTNLETLNFEQRCQYKLKSV